MHVRVTRAAHLHPTSIARRRAYRLTRDRARSCKNIYIVSRIYKFHAYVPCVYVRARALPMDRTNERQNRPIKCDKARAIDNLRSAYCARAQSPLNIHTHAQ